MEANMAKVSFGNWLGMLIVGVFFAGAVVFSTHLATRSLEKVKIRDQTLRVKGTAERLVEADFASWEGSIEARGPGLTEAYTALEESRRKLSEYLAKAGFSGEKVWLGPVGIQKQFERNREGRETNRIESYVLSQSYAISGAGADVEKVARTARDASQLIAQGVELDAHAPAYLCTKLPEMKMEMLSEASSNAYDRARRLAEPSGSRLGPMRSASQGVFQVTPVHSNEVSDEGLSDTTSRAKRVRAVVTVEYGVF
jgi:uncharacterized protein